MTKNIEGSITVFFALLLTLICAIVCSSLEAARYQAYSYFTAQANESALESVFAGYYHPLWENYHLFFMADGPGLVPGMEKYLSYYGNSEEDNERNLAFGNFHVEEIRVQQLITAVDNGGAAFSRAICEDMECHGTEKALSLLDLPDKEELLEEAEVVFDYTEKFSEYGKAVEKIEDTYTRMESQVQILKRQYERLESAAEVPGWTEETGNILVVEAKHYAEEVLSETDKEYKNFLKEIEKLKEKVEQDEKKLQENLAGTKDGEGEVYMMNSLSDLKEYTEKNGQRMKEATALKEFLGSEAKRLLQADAWEEGVVRRDFKETIGQGRAAVDGLAIEIEGRQKTTKKEKSELIELVKQWKSQGILALVLEYPEDISEAYLEKRDYPSKVCNMDEDQDGSLLDKGMEAFYMTEHFGYYGDGRETQGEILSYEAEYIIGNSNSDKENLKKTAEKILAVRTGINFLYLLRDRTKGEEAEALAALLVGVTGSPLLIRLTAKVILGAWAFAEAVNDTKRLFDGEEVPIMKTAEDWKLSIEGKVLAAPVDDSFDENQNKFWNYERYLQILFLSGNTLSQRFRMMDIVEGNLRQKDNGFFMENCISYACVGTNFKIRNHIFYKEAAYGY